LVYVKNFLENFLLGLKEMSTLSSILLIKMTFKKIKIVVNPNKYTEKLEKIALS